jgi:hypothetical protein
MEEVGSEMGAAIGDMDSDTAAESDAPLRAESAALIRFPTDAPLRNDRGVRFSAPSFSFSLCFFAAKPANLVSSL